MKHRYKQKLYEDRILETTIRNGVNELRIYSRKKKGKQVYSAELNTLENPSKIYTFSSNGGRRKTKYGFERQQFLCGLYKKYKCGCDIIVLFGETPSFSVRGTHNSECERYRHSAPDYVQLTTIIHNQVIPNVVAPILQPPVIAKVVAPIVQPVPTTPLQMFDDNEEYVYKYKQKQKIGQVCILDTFIKGGTRVMIYEINGHSCTHSAEVIFVGNPNVFKYYSNSAPTLRNDGKVTQLFKCALSRKEHINCRSYMVHVCDDPSKNSVVRHSIEIYEKHCDNCIMAYTTGLKIPKEMIKTTGNKRKRANDEVEKRPNLVLVLEPVPPTPKQPIDVILRPKQRIEVLGCYPTEVLYGNYFDIFFCINNEFNDGICAKLRKNEVFEIELNGKLQTQHSQCLICQKDFEDVDHWIESIKKGTVVSPEKLGTSDNKFFHRLIGMHVVVPDLVNMLKAKKNVFNPHAFAQGFVLVQFVHLVEDRQVLGRHRNSSAQVQDEGVRHRGSEQLVDVPAFVLIDVDLQDWCVVRVGCQGEELNVVGGGNYKHETKV